MNTKWKNITIVSLIMIFVMGPCFAPIPDYLVDHFEMETATFLQMLSFFVALLIALAVTYLLIRRQNIDLKKIGLSAPTPWYAILVGVIIGLFWAYSSMYSLKNMDPDADVMKLWLTFSPIRFFLILAGPIGACIEDFITRGFIMSELKENRVPTWLQLVLSSLLFAVYHSIWSLPIMGIYFLYGLIPSFIYGLILGGLYLIGKRSLTPVMISHGLTVFVGEPLLTYVLMKSFLM